MITIQSGKLSIPEDERFIGFAGDNTVVTKEFHILRRVVPSSEYTLCLRFDDGNVKTVPLRSAQFGSDVRLTWEIERDDLASTGIVTAQVKMTDGNGNVQHTTKDYFLVGTSVELDDEGREIEHINRSQLEESIKEAVEGIEAKSSYLGDDGYWYVFDKDNEEFFKTGYRGRLSVDSQMDEHSLNPVSNSTVTAYVSEQIAGIRQEIGDIETALAAI